MIHQVNASSRDVERLKELVNLQLMLLKLAAKEPSIDKELIRTHLVSHFNSKTSDVVDWLWRHSSLIDPLKDFSAHLDTLEKQLLVQHIIEDVCLLWSPKSQSLKAAFNCPRTLGPKTDPEWKCAISKFCRRFYEIWGDSKNPGFPGYLFVPPGTSGNAYTRWNFIDGFVENNGGLYLCAMCDATAFRTKVDSNSFTSIEHFFPKSIYPHLAIHPMNLIPICSSCNSIKHDDDLMQLCSAASGITELLLPYQSTQPGLQEMAYIEVGQRARTPNDEQHPLEIKFKPTTHFSTVSPLIDHFNTVYEVEKRWNNELEQIDEQIFRRIQQFLMTDVQMGQNLDDVEYLIDRLELLMALTSTENVGKDPFGMASVWMLKHHIDQLRTDGEKAPAYQVLVDWADQNDDNWTALRTHVVELLQRVPMAGHTAE